jgi:hypothetical protein
VNVSEPIVLTREARVYAVKELARRASVSPELFGSWRLIIERDSTVIYPVAGSDKRLSFRHLRQPIFSDLNTCRVSWSGSTTVPQGGPDVVVPFQQRSDLKEPMFSIGDEAAHCSLDLPLSALLMLARYEETAVAQRDAHGRFPTELMASSRGLFLDRPVVDEWGVAMQDALQRLLPRWQPQARTASVMLTHDIDEVGLPPNATNLKSAIGHALRRRRPGATVRDLVSWSGLGLPSYLRLVHAIVRVDLDRGLTPAVFWKGSRRAPFDSGYDPTDPRIKRTIEALRVMGVENGVHPGYWTLDDPGRLDEELSRLRPVLPEVPLGGRQHYLRWDPAMWGYWADAGLSYDSSVGLPDTVGFRAGTCIPYMPWSFATNRQIDLLEIPLIAMDVALGVGRSSREECYQRLIQAFERCAAVGGIFTLLWHPRSLLYREFGDLYPRVIDALGARTTIPWPYKAKQIY